MQIERPHPPQMTTPPTLRAGAARRDITPDLDAPNGGYGIWGTTQTGVWQRLFCHALVLEGPSASGPTPHGNRVALVACDLHAGTRWLHEAVAARTAHLGVTVNRLVLGASHTHYGPAGLYCDDFYDCQAGSEKGFNRHVGLWAVSRIVEAIEEACAALEPARVGFGESSVWGYAANRSLDAFRRNSVSPASFAAQFDGTPGVDEDELLAVDPRIRVTWAQTRDGRPIGAFATVGVHNTALLPMRDVLSSDWFGWAVRTAQRRLYREGGLWNRGTAEPRLPIGLSVAAAGDVNCRAPDLDPYLARRSRELVEVVGTAYGEALADACLRASQAATDDCRIECRWAEFDASQGTPSLADHPKVGGPTLGAAEGLRVVFGRHEERMWFETSGVVQAVMRNLSEWVHRHCPEGTVSDAAHAQAPKQLFPEETPRVPRPFESVLRYFQGQANRLFPLRIVSVGNHHWFAVPGEPTISAGRQLERAVVAVLGGTAGVLGACGDYIGYFTTHAEYQLQHYEGSSTLWGPNSTPWLDARLRELAHRIPGSAPLGTIQFTPRAQFRHPVYLRSGGASRPTCTPIDDGYLIGLPTPWMNLTLGQGAFVQLQVKQGENWVAARHEGALVNDQEFPVEIRRGRSNRRFIWSAKFRFDAAMRAELGGRTLRFELQHPQTRARFGHLYTDDFQL